MQVTDEAHYRILQLIEQNPQISQRELAEKLGLSLGKTNYCVQALIEKGVIKASTFYNSNNKRAYIYVLTPRGIRERAEITLRFLQKKTAEYEMLKTEIADIRKHMNRRPVDERSKQG